MERKKRKTRKMDTTLLQTAVQKMSKRQLEAFTHLACEATNDCKSAHNEALIETIQKFEGSVENFVKKGLFRQKRNITLKALSQLFEISVFKINKIIKQYLNLANKKTESVKELAPGELQEKDPNKSAYSMWYEQIVEPLQQELKVSREQNLTYKKQVNSMEVQKTSLEQDICAKNSLIVQLKDQNSSIKQIINTKEAVQCHLENLQKAIEIVGNNFESGRIFTRNKFGKSIICQDFENASKQWAHLGCTLEKYCKILADLQPRLKNSQAAA